MITTTSDFHVTYNVNDGEVASAAVLSRPTNRLKLEINELENYVSLALGDSTNIPVWVSATYEAGSLVSYNGVIYKAMSTTTITPGTNNTIWSDMSETVNKYNNLGSGSGGSGGSGGTGGSFNLSVETFIATSGQTVFTVLGDISNGAVVFIDGIYNDPTLYTIDSVAKTVTFNNPVVLGSTVNIGLLTSVPTAAISASLPTSNIDLATGGLFYKTISANTTLTIANPLAAGKVSTFILELVNGGAYTITWPTSVKWPGGTAPTLTTSGKDVLEFYSYDAGTTWINKIITKNVK
jgi:hypothetical protein